MEDVWSSVVKEFCGMEIGKQHNSVEGTTQRKKFGQYLSSVRQRTFLNDVEYQINYDKVIDITINAIEMDIVNKFNNSQNSTYIYLLSKCICI